MMAKQGGGKKVLKQDRRENRARRFTRLPASLDFRDNDLGGSVTQLQPRNPLGQGWQPTGGLQRELQQATTLTPTFKRWWEEPAKLLQAKTWGILQGTLGSEKQSDVCSWGSGGRAEMEPLLGPIAQRWV
jgi:hypothetical protein